MAVARKCPASRVAHVAELCGAARRSEGGVVASILRPGYAGRAHLPGRFQSLFVHLGLALTAPVVAASVFAVFFVVAAAILAAAIIPTAARTAGLVRPAALAAARRRGRIRWLVAAFCGLRCEEFGSFASTWPLVLNVRFLPSLFRGGKILKPTFHLTIRVEETA